MISGAGGRVCCAGLGWKLRAQEDSERSPSVKGLAGKVGPEWDFILVFEARLLCIPGTHGIPAGVFQNH